MFGKCNKLYLHHKKRSLRKNDTSIVLNLKQLQTEEAKNKKIVEEFKLEEEEKNLLVSSFEDSLKAHDNLKAIDTLDEQLKNIVFKLISNLDSNNGDSN